MSTKQQTLKAPISFSGKGLHTGVKVTMTVNPAEVDTGIVFRRTDLEGQPIIPALCDYVVDTSRGTTIESGGHRVSTIEHIMSARPAPMPRPSPKRASPTRTPNANSTT